MLGASLSAIAYYLFAYGPFGVVLWQAAFRGDKTLFFHLIPFHNIFYADWH